MMSFPVSNVFLESPWPTVIFISVTMSPELNIRIMYLILLDVLTPIYSYLSNIVIVQVLT